jgi:hypothetical protein
LDDCLPDLSLYFSNSPNGSSTNLFDGGPEHGQIQPGAYPIGYYPNLQSFQRTDRKLKLLLNDYPSMYIQVLLVTEPYHNARNTEWRKIDTTLRTQLWQNMIARWAAFPNVFWSVSNDLGDTSGYSDNRLLADEIGCYWMGGCNEVGAGNDPWSANRPMSMGHLRNRIDGSIAKTWHTYITAYSYADISAQQMDGATNLEPYPTPTVLFQYTATPKPVYNTEDLYEAGSQERDTDYKLVVHADYFFRKLFWSYLLSGGGVTYGSETTWSMEHVYDGGTYIRPPTPIPSVTQTVEDLVGLNSIGSVDLILHQARVDLADFAPHDQLIPQATPGSTWTEYERAQVASNAQEILAYIPNTVRTPSSQQPDYLYRRKAEESQTTRSVTVDMDDYGNPSYRVTWYEPATGAVLNTGTIPGNPGPGSYRPTLTPPPNAGDVVLHISSRCESPNACLPMDTEPPTSTPTPTGTPSAPAPGFHVGADLNAVVVRDDLRGALKYDGTASWRCDRTPANETGTPGCWVSYIFPTGENGRTVASADFYFRRNSQTPYQGLYFITASGSDPGAPIGYGENAISLDVTFDPAGNLVTGGDQGNIALLTTSGAAPDLNRWYHLFARAERTAINTYTLRVYVDGVKKQERAGLRFRSEDPHFRHVLVHTAWWSPTTDLPPGSIPSVWWDEFSIDPPAPGETAGLYRTTFQQGLAGYTGNHGAYFGGGNGVNNSAQLKVGANGTYKTLLWFNTSSLPSQAIVDEATLDLYYTGRDNGNILTLGAHRVLAGIDSEVTHFQRKAGINWTVAGMGSGSDYTASPEATLPLGSVASGWVQLDVTAAVQAWIADHANNHGLVVLQEAASGWVTYQFCSELGWTPCTPAQAPRLVIRYHLQDPAPVKATFQQGVGGYSGANATCLAYSSSNNSCTLFKAGADDGLKSPLRFDLSAIPTGKTVDEATLRLYYKGRSNGNGLTLGAYRLLAPWLDSQATWTQRMTGANWVVPGLGSGSDYLADGSTEDVLGDGGSWVEIDVTEMAQAWVDDPAANYGLILRQASAAGYVIYDFCSERGVSPCTAAQAPQLTVWYR